MKQNWKAQNLAAHGEQAQEQLAGLQKQFPQLKLTKSLEKALIKTLGNAFFLSRYLRRSPETLAHLFQDPQWQTTKSLKNYQNQEHYQKVFQAPNKDSAQKLLLAFKYQELLRISLKDLGLGVAFEEIALELSELALAIIQASLHTSLLNLGLSSEILKNFSILALGKLGGSELNFSSDVDLIYFCKTPDTKDTSLEIFHKLAQNFTQILNQKSPEGFLYRVDLELRPHGARGALVPTLEALEEYYESLGQNWERMAMIRAKGIAGSLALSQIFIQSIQPFVYPRHSDYAFLEDLMAMRQKILSNLKNTSNDNYHVKLGQGGIRQLEFFVQSFQVLYGGKQSQLQNPSLLKALKNLEKLKLLKASDVTQLKEAYVFLRTVENRLQQMEERQTHQLPKDPLAQTALLRGLGYEDDLEQAQKDFEQKLNQHRQVISNHFDKLLS
ncbi:MAG: hypothetical protein KDK66_04420 [Deltaproteobacteria bacterium]|nr:hypothetical protein [Deltaproteobacteria bacterium]